MPRSHPGLRPALNALLSGTGFVGTVRAEIAASWRRAAASGLRPDRFEIPYDPDIERAGRLEQAAAPVMDQLSDDLVGTDTSLVLTDARGHVLERRVPTQVLQARLDDILLAPGFDYSEHVAGTNGIGAALARRAPVFVRGDEHFADVLTDMACAGVPITDPRNGQVLGIVDVTCSVVDSNSLMLPLARRAAWEIEQRLLDGGSAIERLLYERFLQARRRAKGPVALVSEYRMLTNPSAARLLDSDDQSFLWEWAGEANSGHATPPSELSLLNGVVVITDCEPVLDGGTRVGAIVRLRSAEEDIGAKARGTPAVVRPSLGWSSLTDTERSVADLVAQGLTNREAASRLFVSPYTVDTHLRHIYRKLDIGSRAELARLVAEHSG